MDQRTDEAHKQFAALFGEDEAASKDACCVLATMAFVALLRIADAQERIAYAAEGGKIWTPQS